MYLLFCGHTTHFLKIVVFEPFTGFERQRVKQSVLGLRRRRTLVFMWQNGLLPLWDYRTDSSCGHSEDLNDSSGITGWTVS